MRRNIFLLSLMISSICGAQVAMLPNAPAPSLEALTLQQAEQIALQKNPRIAVGRLLALAEGQVARQARAGFLPTLSGSITAVEARDGSRITAGNLNNPVLYQRAAAGMTLSQLITDFGRTKNLAASATLRAKAQHDLELATQADVLLAVDEAFYRALGSQQVLAVAQGTVNARQQITDRISALAGAKLKSDLDLNFANVNLAQAKLLLLDSQNENLSAMAALNALLGSDGPQRYSLVDQQEAMPPAPLDAEALVQQAMQSRPDMVALNDRYEAAKKFAKAEADLSLPTISALGAAGGTPVRADAISQNWYGAIGVNISIPIFNGFLYSAREQEARLRADAAGKQVEVLRNQIASDVRTTVLQAQSNFERINVTQQLVEQANNAFELAQTRYRLGLSSIVELSQAELAQTQAQISYATARYAYRGTLAALRYQTGP